MIVLIILKYDSVDRHNWRFFFVFRRIQGIASKHLQNNKITQVSVKKKTIIEWKLRVIQAWIVETHWHTGVNVEKKIHARWGAVIWHREIVFFSITAGKPQLAKKKKCLHYTKYLHINRK